MSETVQDVSPVVRRVEIRATPERVFALFTEPESLVKWWPEAATFEPHVGGEVRLVFKQGEVTGAVTAFDPPGRLGFTWVRSDEPEITTYVDVTFSDTGDGRCAVELVHSGWEAVPAEARAEWRQLHDLGWSHFLPLLADLAEGRPVDKSFG